MSIAAAVAALREGKVIGMPTDTVYGVAADPHHEGATAHLYEIKGRPGAKAVPILAATVAQAGMVAEFAPATERLALDHWPGPLTLVLPRRPVMPEWVGDARAGTVAVRIPDHPVALELLAATGPLAVTSANLAGDPPACDDDSARATFGDAVAVYVAGTCRGGDSSTVIDVTASPPVLLRPGPVPWPLDDGR